MINQKHLLLIACTTLLATPVKSGATELQFTPYIGKMFSSDLVNIDNNEDLMVDNGTSYGLGIAWQDTMKGQGQILINAVSHDFISSNDQQKQSFDIIYAHFNGVALFKQKNYLTSVSLGVGAAYFDTDSKEEFYPSFTIALGTRYKITDNLSFVTELRSYLSIIEADNQLFCADDNCHGFLNESLWVENTVMIGLAFKF